MLSHLLIYDVPSYSEAIDNIEKKYERLSANWMVCGLFCMFFFVNYDRFAKGIDCGPCL